LSGFVLDLLSCLKGAEAGHRDVRVMDKQIISSGIGGDESEPLVFIEPLYRTCIQMFFSLARISGLLRQPPCFLPGVPPPRQKEHSLTLTVLKQGNCRESIFFYFQVRPNDSVAGSFNKLAEYADIMKRQKTERDCKIFCEIVRKSEILVWDSSFWRYTVYLVKKEVSRGVLCIIFDL